MAPAIRHDLSELRRARKRRRYPRRIGTGSTRRTPVPETAVASTARAAEGRSWRGSARVKFESPTAALVRYSRFYRYFRGSKRKPPEKSRRWAFHATLFAMSAPAPDKENRILPQKQIPAACRGNRQNKLCCDQSTLRQRCDE